MQHRAVLLPLRLELQLPGPQLQWNEGIPLRRRQIKLL